MAYLMKRLSTCLMLILLLALAATVPTGCASKPTPQPVAAYQDTEKAPDPTMITDIRTVGNEQGTIVRISGNRMLTFTSVKQAEPMGVVFYFPNTGLAPAVAANIPEKGIIGTVESSELTTDNKTVRVAINLTRDSTYSVNRGGNDLEIIFPTAAAAIAEAPPLAAADAEMAQPEARRQETFEAEPATMVSEISAETGDQRALIRIAANGAIEDYTYFTLTDPPRIVYD